MKTKSKNNAKNRVTPAPKLTRKSRLPALVRVPVPPERAAWQRGGADHEPYRQVTQERAREITGKSRHTVKRWANASQRIDSSSLRLLQVYVWGLIPAPGFAEAGIFIAQGQRWHPDYAGAPESLIATDSGYLIGPNDLLSFGWLRGAYLDHLQRRQAQEAQESAPAASQGARIIPFADYLARKRGPDTDTGTDQA